MIKDDKNKIIILEFNDCANVSRIIKSNKDSIKYDKNGHYILNIYTNRNDYKYECLFDLNDIIEYSIQIMFKHYIFYDVNGGYIEMYNENTIHNIKELIDNNFCYIDFSCTTPEVLVAKLINDLNLTDINIAELGVKYGETTIYNINNIHGNIKSYSLFEREKFFCNFLEKNIKYDNLIVYKGLAQDNLRQLDDSIIYDFVFFDCSHKYENDKLILEQLKKHINENTVVCFHDYDFKDIEKLVTEFKEEKLCKIYAIYNGEKIIKILDNKGTA